MWAVDILVLELKVLFRIAGELITAKLNSILNRGVVGYLILLLLIAPITLMGHIMI